MSNVTLVREAIFTVLDEREWNFEDDEQRVDFADRVASFIPSESAPIGPATAAHDRMVRDAGRYRWLRLHFRFANDSMHEIWFDRSINHSALKGQGGEELDRSVDQAMEGK